MCLLSLSLFNAALNAASRGAALARSAPANSPAGRMVGAAINVQMGLLARHACELTSASLILYLHNPVLVKGRHVCICVLVRASPRVY